MMMDNQGPWAELRWHSFEGKHEIVVETGKRRLDALDMLVDFHSRNRCAVRLARNTPLYVEWADGPDCDWPVVSAENRNQRVLKSWAVPVLPLDEDRRPLGQGEVLVMMPKNKTGIRSLSLLFRKLELELDPRTGDKVPLVRHTDTLKAGFNDQHKGYEPVYSIIDWVERPTEFDLGPWLRPPMKPVRINLQGDGDDTTPRYTPQNLGPVHSDES